MSRSGKIFAISGGVVLAIAIAAVVTGVSLVRSGWVEEKIREKIVDSAETATGGKIELGALHVDWKTWAATVDRLVIHGTEPAGADPLLSVRRVVVGLKIVSFLARDVNVQSVEVDDPRANLIILADGTTNLPQPKTKRTAKPIPETILGLKIGKFDLLNGAVAVDRGGSKSVTPWNARGDNLMAHVTYNAAGPRYDGTISIAPLTFVWKQVRVVPRVALTASMERNRVTVSTAAVKFPQSEIDLSNVVVNDFTKPATTRVTTGHYTARVALAEADQVFHLVNFRHTGTLNGAGDFRYVSMIDYNLTGDVTGSGIGYGKVPDMRVAAKVAATPDNVVANGLVIDAMGGQMRGNAEVRKLQDIHLAGRLDHFDARQLASLGGAVKLPYDGIVSGPFDLNGKLEESNLHRLVAEATLAIAPAPESVPVHGAIAAKYDGAANTVALGRSWVELPSTRLDLTGTLGQRLDVRLSTHDLGDLTPVVDLKPLRTTLSQSGSITFDGTVTGALADPHIAGHAIVQNASVRGQQIDSLAGDFTATKTRATVTNVAVTASDLRGRITGSIDLRDWKPADSSAMTANVQLIDADATKLLALAGETSVPVTGTLNTTAQISGTVGDPHATADLALAKGQIYGEPYDSITGKAQYVNGGAQVVTAVLDAGRKRLNASLRFDHPDKLTFNLSSNAMAINQIALARKYEPTLGGTAQVKANGVVRIDRGKTNTRIEVLDLNADVRGTGLTLTTRSLGDAHITADTNNGVLTAKIDSDIAKSTIHGDGTVRLTGDYPIDAKLTFANLGLSAVAAVARGQKEGGQNPGANEANLDGSAAGDVTLSGLATKLDAITATLNVTQLEIHPLTVTGAAKNIPNLSLKNNGPIRATLSKSVIRVDSARFSAPSTDLTLTGTVALNAQSGFDLRAQGNMNLALLEAVDSDLTASGQLALNATVRGSYTNPDVSGRADLQKGDFHLANISNGLTNANGVILFSGTRATIQTLSAESGGGKVNVTGFGALANGRLTFGIDARTREVRVRYPEGVSSISDADLNLSGTSERSQVSGTVTVRRVSINPKSDLSTILAGAAEPLKTPEGNTGALSNINLDVQIETAPDVAFETNVAQSLQADANLRLRGTVTNPAVLGRINITQGEASFFGNKYTINQGSISFFNPAKIDPVLNVDLETKARGVDVVLTVTGPLNKLNVSYRSDPPLQFSDIVGLLATGRTPTDPTLAVRDTGQSQSLQQLGATALIGQAIANPVAGRLQRFFGVSKIKIDPQLTGITGSPEARLTIEQQISPELLFTYITDVSSTSTQLIRVEWDFNRKWSAILTREENGYVGVDFAFKKRFK